VRANLLATFIRLLLFVMFYKLILLCIIYEQMQLFYKIIGSGAEINHNTYSILLKNLLAVGNWRKYIEVTCNQISVVSYKIKFHNF